MAEDFVMVVSSLINTKLHFNNLKSKILYTKAKLSRFIIFLNTINNFGYDIRVLSFVVYNVSVIQKYVVFVVSLQ